MNQLHVVSGVALCGGRSLELKEAIERETKDLRGGEKYPFG
jgi:hypothetical protein